jgi:hypothetical protein
MIRGEFSIGMVLIALNLLFASRGGEEVFIGNPGKTLNFLPFDLYTMRRRSNAQISALFAPTSSPRACLEFLSC